MANPSTTENNEIQLAVNGTTTGLQGAVSSPPQQVQQPSSQQLGYPPSNQQVNDQPVMVGNGQHESKSSEAHYPTTQPQTYPSTTQPQTYPSTTQPQTYPSTTQPQTYPPTTQPQTHPPTTQPQTYPSTTQPQTYPPTTQPQTYPSTTQPQTHPPAYEQKNLPPGTNQQGQQGMVYTAPPTADKPKNDDEVMKKLALGGVAILAICFLLFMCCSCIAGIIVAIAVPLSLTAQIEDI